MVCEVIKYGICRALHQSIIWFVKYLQYFASEHYMICEVSAVLCIRALYDLWTICRGLHKNITWLVDFCIRALYCLWSISRALLLNIIQFVSAELWTLFPYVPGWLVYGANFHFQQYFCYIVAVSFIVGGIQSTQRKPSTCRKSLTNFIT